MILLIHLCDWYFCMVFLKCFVSWGVSVPSLRLMLNSFSKAFFRVCFRWVMGGGDSSSQVRQVTLSFAWSISLSFSFSMGMRSAFTMVVISKSTRSVPWKRKTFWSSVPPVPNIFLPCTSMSFRGRNDAVMPRSCRAVMAG